MPDTPIYRSPLSLLPLIAIPAFLAIANQTMVSVALPNIGADLGEVRRLPWLVMGYMIALTIAGPVYGVLGDSYGRARMLLIALCVYIAGTALAAMAWNFPVLASARLLQGLGGGGLMSLSQALIGDVVAPRDRGRAQGNIAAISVLASTAGPLVAGVLVVTFGWRSLFLVTIPLALLAITVLLRTKIPRRAAAAGRFDLQGFLSLVLLVTGLTGAIEMVSVPGLRLWAGLAAVAAAAGIFGLLSSQRRAANALFPAVIFKTPALNRASLAIFCHGAALVSLVTTIPLFHAILRTDGAFVTATTMLALTVAFGVAGIIAGNLVTITGRTVLFPSLSLPVSVAALMFLAFYGAELSRPALMANYLLIGLTFGWVMPVLNTVVQVTAADEIRGRAIGAITFARSIGAVVGTALTAFVLFAVAPSGSDAGAILSGALSADTVSRAGWELAFRATFATIAGFVVLEWVLVVLNPARRVE
ncbi:MFS transporter [Pararhodobacter zhoushanensis]|uniref:MFS transporter n=1 Tax=Pararhodobacter zhoushanensis TaxID=2479545 RepID=UPI0013E0D7F4|nr:MFS transporter [Pararhodobacter zhoushanensis]